MTSIFCILIITGWTVRSTPVSTDLFSVACVSATECWAVGISGTILHTTDAGQTWDIQNSGTSEDLFGISFVDDLTGWVAGYGPTILHTTDGGETWTEQTPGTPNDLLDISFANHDRGWATGITGTIMGTTNGGANWASEISGQWPWLWGVIAVSPTRAWTTGADWFNNIAPIYAYNGSAWTQQYEITTTKDGKALAAADADHVWMVGGGGNIYYTVDGGSNWVNQTSNTTATIWDVSASSPSRSWAVGSNGLILHTTDNGSHWQFQDSPVADSLLGVAMFDDQHGWIVGENGTALYTQDGGTGCTENEHHAVQRWKIFPNPVMNEVNILPGSETTGHIDIHLFDALGRRITDLYSGRMNGHLRLDLGFLSPGTYFLVVQTEKEYATHRIDKVLP